jgi:phage terminase small subunit
MTNDDLIGDVTNDAGVEIMPPRNSLQFQHEIFCYKYVELKRNGTAAAEAAGYSPGLTARNMAFNLLKRPEIRARIIELAAPVLRKAKLDMEEMLGHIHAVATFDRRKLYHPDGRRKLFIELDTQTASAISHMGATDFVPYDKMKAIDMAMKHLGGFEKDNEQRRENLQIAVTFT